MNDSFSTLATFTDDYGEEDFSLRSYRNESSSSASSSSQYCNNSVAQQDANELLLQSQVTEFHRSASKNQQCVSRGGRCTFIAGGTHKIEVSLRGDSSAIVISTEVHNLHQGDVVKGQKKMNHCQSGSYSLMTLMMKHNAILERAAPSEYEREHIGVHDGKFVLFAIVPIAVLSNKKLLERSLDNFILKAVEISKDFSKAEKSRKAKLLRRKLLMRAYNRTML